MPTSADIQWFKDQYQPSIEAAIAGTPLSVDFVVALACKETGNIWPLLRRAGLPSAEVEANCVGDTLDEDRGRRAFPKNKAELLRAPRGGEMFAIGRQALQGMARFIPSYAGAAAMPNKFCHGYGIFQRDLQFFLKEPEFFLDRTWATFQGSLDHAMAELHLALIQLDLQDRPAPLADLDLAHVGIVYNTGRFRPEKGLKQGFKGPQETQFYGERLFDLIRLCHTVAPTGGRAALPSPPAGQAIVAAPSVPDAPGTPMRVQTQTGMLRVRREPLVSAPPQANVVANLPDGHPVTALGATARNGFLEIESSLSGALVRGFSSRKFLVPDAAATPIPVVQPAAAASRAGTPAAPLVAEVPGTSNIPAVFMPRKAGTVTRRTEPANAHSLNENGQPARSGTSADALRASIAAIVDWLAVDKAAHLRYQPRAGLTFCNIYAHDFCFLADIYLPRVWWSSAALLKLAAGQTVPPLIGDTIREMRANDLFRWLRDFGPGFGWRQTGTLTKLQTEVDQGGVGLIVARRKEDGRSGHIVVVVPETDEHMARRNGAAEVVAPLQSQAGARNFRYGTGAPDWWMGEEFAEFAFWLHA